MPPDIMVTDCSEELLCAICCDSWKDPIEMVPCGHIFCRACVKDVKTCPLCRGSVTNMTRPNRTLVNISLAVPVKCVTCGWTGTREQGNSHVCGSGTNKPTAPLSSVPGSRYPLVQPTSATPWIEYGLTQGEYDQIMALFLSFDDDESGGLDRREVGRLARWLNFARSDADIDRIFRDMDADGSGTLSLNEFLTWLRHNRPDPKALYGLSQAEYNTVMMQFRMYDKNQDGLLSMGEFARLALNLGEVGNIDAGRQLFTFIDTNGNGTVDLHEFLIYRSRTRRS
ncbi:uncharacterized protein TM35_002881000 [Trypanosoma theileri]|uniref:EF hand n=1 Tax=Trypanosoma theileri TaxID=67003 RepID=A0A1X0NCU6_9TRYP|nr:uncharacterized protein TM35_002881000 [Trypanosoma theileri]ORC76862.1 hypothetical protein TM35_002881000 [Trypanosoma theileri]